MGTPLTREDDLPIAASHRLPRTAWIDDAFRAAKGTVSTVNRPGEGDVTTPFGFCRQSGFGGRGSREHAHDRQTRITTIRVEPSETAGSDIG